MITIPTGEFVGLLADALPFACPIADLSAINAVRLEWDGDMLHAMATDRFAIGWSSWSPDDDPDDDQQESLFTQWGGGDLPWSASIPAADAKHLATTFKLGRKEQWLPATVDYDDDRGRLRIARERTSDRPGLSVVIDVVQDPFPDVRQMLANAEAAVGPVLGLDYNASLLATFAKVRNRGPMCMRYAGNRHATLVTIGPRFRGAIMPVTPAERLAADPVPS